MLREWSIWAPIVVSFGIAVVIAAVVDILIINPRIKPRTSKEFLPNLLHFVLCIAVFVGVYLLSHWIITIIILTRV